MLFEKCPTCKGTRLIDIVDPVRIGAATLRAGRRCTACKDGYKVHECPEDDTCPCFMAGYEKGVMTPREPMGV